MDIGKDLVAASSTADGFDWLLLQVNLAWSARLSGRFLLRRGPYRALERWQTGSLPVLAAWAAVVVLLFPPLFGFR